MPQTSFTTEILASQERVWEIMTDYERYSKWSPAKKISLEKEGSPEKNGKGAIRVFHSGIKIREEITNWNKPNSMTYRLLVNWPIKNYEATMELNSDSGTTQLIWSSKWENRLPRFLNSIPEKIIRKSLKDFAKGIKTDAENTPHNLINPANVAPAAANYSLGALSTSPTKQLFTSGIVPTRPDGTIPKDISEQAEVVWETITTLLEESGLQINDIVSMTTYVAKKESKNLQKVISVRDKFMKDHLPASTLVVVPQLANKKWKLEIAVIASY